MMNFGYVGAAGKLPSIEEVWRNGLGCDRTICFVRKLWCSGSHDNCAEKHCSKLDAKQHISA